MAAVVFELLEPLVADALEGGVATATETALAEGAEGAWADAIEAEEREVFADIFEQPAQQQAAEAIVAQGEEGILANAGLPDVAAEDLVPPADREQVQQLTWSKLEEMQANLTRIGADKTLPPGMKLVATAFFTLSAVMIQMAAADAKTRDATATFNEANNEMTDLENSLEAGDMTAVKKKALALKTKIDAVIGSVIQKGLDGTGLTAQQYQALVKMRTVLSTFITTM